jgi:MFS family permease
VIARYRQVLADPVLRRILLLGLLIRLPMFTAMVVVTLHVVSHLGRSYGAAGTVSGALTLAIAVAGPWRGRLLDRHGLRRVVLPSLLVGAVCWSVAPFVGYWWLLALVVVAGLFFVPIPAIMRQAVIAVVPESERRTAISLDSVLLELSFLIGPPLGVWAATTYPTPWVLLVLQLLGVAAGGVLWLANPAIVTPGARPDTTVAGHAVGTRSWFRPRLVAVLVATVATMFVLGASDLAFVAALRDFGAVGSVGWVLAVWGLGSLVGGLVYGGWHRSFSAFWLLGGLALVTAPMALAGGPLSLAGLSFVAGLLCAPTITATVDQVSRVVPESARSEAMGWHASAMTVGMAVGAPAAGAAMDRTGWPAGFLVAAGLGLTVALAGAVATTVARRGVRVPVPADEAAR